MSAPAAGNQLRDLPTRPSRLEQLLAFGILLVSSLYRPLIFWANNAWNISSPLKPLAVGAAALALGLSAWWLLTKLGIRSIPAALGVGGSLLVLFHWQNIEVLTPFLWLGLLAVVVWVSHKLASKKALEAIAIVVIAVLGVSPIAQLFAEHIRQAQPYQLVPLADRAAATPTGAVEDLVLVVIDSYPAPAIAETWFGHKAEALHDSLTDNGMVVHAVGLSQHTFTILAVPSILELQPIAGEGSAGSRGNRRRLREIMGGDSLTRRSLESAGFRYTHVEGGVDGTSCGSDVDVCVNSPWMDERAWKLLQLSVLGPYLNDRDGSWGLAASIAAANNVTRVLEDVQGNGVHDYVFAHIILPHPPTVADSECGRLAASPSSGAAQIGIEADSRPDDRFEGQLACADRLITQVAAALEPSTAIVIASDHGTGFNGQVSTSPDTWSDSDIVERFGILLAHRMPKECPEPVAATNIDVMRAVLACTVDMNMPARQPRFLIGLVDPEWVDPSRMDLIRERLEDGDIPRPEQPDAD